MNADNFYSIAHSLWVVFGPTPAGIISDLWILFLLYWLVSALNRKKTKRRESIVQRLVYILPLIAAFYLLYRYEFGNGWLLCGSNDSLLAIIIIRRCATTLIQKAFEVRREAHWPPR